MTLGQFEESLRALLRRQPFEPFEVELLDGERFTVDRNDAVSIGGGSAGFIGEDGMVRFFDWRNTRRLGTSISNAPA
jgi:hypothetical protein